MKSPYLLPALTAAIGFAIAWIAKPGSAPESQATVPVETPTRKSGTRDDSPRSRPPATGDERTPKEVSANDFPLADLAAQGPKTRGEAKMLRLSEALGLSIDQQGEIIKVIEETKAAASDAVPVLDDLTSRGRKVEETLSKVLTPEQFAKFEELRVRERENRIEARAQRALAQIIDEIDLSPGQREDLLGRLRQAEKERIQAVPAAATLLLNTSVLPTGTREMTIDGVLALGQISQSPPTDDPMAAREQFLQNQRRQLEEKLQRFDGVLTPGQMGQYHAIIAEERALTDSIQAAPLPK
jgi:hypothetical protein